MQNEIFKHHLSSCACVGVLASEEDDEAIVVRQHHDAAATAADNADAAATAATAGRYVVVFDPLDGSRNIDAAIPTGMRC